MAIPDMCLRLLDSTVIDGVGDVIRIKAGETGYYPSTYGRRPAEWVLMENARLGVTVAQAEAMEVCSFSGQWSRLMSLRRPSRPGWPAQNNKHTPAIVEQGDLLNKQVPLFCPTNQTIT